MVCPEFPPGYLQRAGISELAADTCSDKPGWICSVTSFSLFHDDQSFFEGNQEGLGPTD